MVQLLFLLLLLSVLPVSRAADPLEPRQASATEMFFRGKCRNLKQSATKLVWAASENCLPIDAPDYTFVVSEDCVRDPPTEFGHSGSSAIASKRAGLLHTKYASDDCSGPETQTSQIIADKCVQIGSGGKSGATGSYIWRERTGRQKVVDYGQYHDKDCKTGVSPTEMPNVFVLEGCHDIGKLECLGDDVKLVAQRLGSSKECLEKDTFGVFESVGSACVASAAVRCFRVPLLGLLFACAVFFAQSSYLL